MITRFEAVPIGGRFEFRGRRYEKMAGTIACDEERFGNHFHPGTEVFCATPVPPPFSGSHVGQAAVTSPPRSTAVSEFPKTAGSPGTIDRNRGLIQRRTQWNCGRRNLKAVDWQ